MKGIIIQKGTIKEICNDLKEIKTEQRLKEFLIDELNMVQERINNFELDYYESKIREINNRKLYS